MGFGGSALAANQTIRNNRNLLKQKRKVGKFSYVSKNKEAWKDHKKASFDQLMHIRHTLRKERQARRIKITIFTLIGIVALMVCYFLIDWSLLFKNFFSDPRM